MKTLQLWFGPEDRYWVGNGGSWSDTGHWSSSSGGTSGASIPGASTRVIFDENSFTDPDYNSVDIDGSYSVYSFEATLDKPAYFYFEDSSTFETNSFNITTTSNVWMTDSIGGRSYWYIIVPSGIVKVENTLIERSQASGGARFLAYTTWGNIDNGWNSGWIFDLEYGNIFLKFDSITIEQGAVLIDDTYRLAIKNYDIYFADIDDDVTINIYANNIANAITPTTGEEVNALALTTPVVWNLTSQTEYDQYSLINVTSLLQQIVNRLDWVSGNSVLLILKPHHSNAAFYLNNYDYSYNLTKTAKLLKIVED